MASQPIEIMELIRLLITLGWKRISLTERIIRGARTGNWLFPCLNVLFIPFSERDLPILVAKPRRADASSTSLRLYIQLVATELLTLEEVQCRRLLEELTGLLQAEAPEGSHNSWHGMVEAIPRQTFHGQGRLRTTLRPFRRHQAKEGNGAVQHSSWKRLQTNQQQVSSSQQWLSVGATGRVRRLPGNVQRNGRFQVKALACPATAAWPQVACRPRAA
jgi:hypothetical protein